MFDVGFWEILLILVLALVIIGPERLPGAARKVGFFVGKARRYIEGVRSEVESEFDMTEFKRVLHNQEVQINELQDQLKTGVEDIKNDMPDPVSASDMLTDTPPVSYYDDPSDTSEGSPAQDNAKGETQSKAVANDDAPAKDTGSSK